MYDDVVMAPTGGPNGPFATRAQARKRRKAPLCLLDLGARCAVLSHLLWATPASADAPLRITGSLTIDASASLRQGSSEVQARLLDDAGHAVTGAELRIKPLNAQVWTARDCHARAPEPAANTDGVYVAHSDGSGALCVHFEGLPEHAEFDLNFSDPNGLYGPVTRHVVADSAAKNCLQSDIQLTA